MRNDDDLTSRCKCKQCKHYNTDPDDLPCNNCYYCIVRSSNLPPKINKYARDMNIGEHDSIGDSFEPKGWPPVLTKKVSLMNSLQDEVMQLRIENKDIKNELELLKQRVENLSNNQRNMYYNFLKLERDVIND